MDGHGNRHQFVGNRFWREDPKKKRNKCITGCLGNLFIPAEDRRVLDKSHLRAPNLHSLGTILPSALPQTPTYVPRPTSRETVPANCRALSNSLMAIGFTLTWAMLQGIGNLISGHTCLEGLTAQLVSNVASLRSDVLEDGAE